MGGCCCFTSNGTELNIEPAYYYYPRTSDEHVPLSSQDGTISTFSSGILVDTNLDTSIPDTYRSPPPPRPYDVDFGSPHMPPVIQQISGYKTDIAVQSTNSDSDQEVAGGNARETSLKCDEMMEQDCKKQNNYKVAKEKGSEIELSKYVESVVEDEDCCPTCLEEYDEENPKVNTKCDHHFHLACILEWMERSDTCPVCDQEMIISLPVD